LSVFNKQIKSEGMVSMRIINNETASLIKLENFNGTYIWQDAWANFNGDERALSPEQLKLCSKQEMYPPPPQDMFIRFTEPIYNQLTAEIRQFYKD